MDYREKVTYDSKRRFCSYWHQIREALACEPRTILEVGTGSGFVSRYLRAVDITLTTCDIEDAYKPDVIAYIVNLPFADNAFDTVMACEVLEHLVYEEARGALRELYRVTSRHVVISLPDATPVACIQFPIPGVKKIKWLLNMPRFFPRAHQVTKHGHQWEIGKKNYPLSRVIGDMQKTGFTLKRTYRVFENPYHRFFILQK